MPKTGHLLLVLPIVLSGFGTDPGLLKLDDEHELSNDLIDSLSPPPRLS